MYTNLSKVEVVVAQVLDGVEEPGLGASAPGATMHTNVYVVLLGRLSGTVIQRVVTIPFGRDFRAPAIVDTREPQEEITNVALEGS